MKTVEIIQRIEGEARLRLFWKDKIIEYAQIEFLNFRGFELMLQNKPILDALVLTPRICGICGQAHLMATVNAIENLYKNSGYQLEISQKAQNIRQIALNFEIISSHIKWFYLFILPDILAYNKMNNTNDILQNEYAIKALKYSSEALKAIAVIAGQWPHSSFALPGGIVSDPTKYELILVENYLDSVLNFVEKTLFGIDFDRFMNAAFEMDLHKVGKSYNRFINLGENANFDIDKISVQTNQNYSKASTILYDSDFYETGPLARMLYKQDLTVSKLYEQHQDSAIVRISARVLELPQLIWQTKKLLDKTNIKEKSYIKPKIEPHQIEYARGYGVVEASRGSLLHKIEVKNGSILNYSIVTPTAWNLGAGDKRIPGTTQKAIIGVENANLAKIILRSFDVCAVCTTH